MLPMIEIILRRSIALDHPRWTWEQIVVAVREALQGRGDSAVLAADLLAAESAKRTPRYAKELVLPRLLEKVQCWAARKAE